MKTVIITGASTGIGRTIAQTFYKNEYNLVINSSNKENLQRAFEDLGSPENVKMVVGDVSDKATGEELVNVALNDFKSIDVLINNAGIFSPKPFLDVDEEELQRFFNVNLKGTFLTSQAVIKEMRNRGGSVINIGTVLVDHAIAGFPATAAVASKGAIHAFTKQLAAEFGDKNIRVNTISPGIIRSPLQSKIGVENADDLANLHLLKRVGETKDIAKMAYFLATSTFITGETINVDGGHVAGHQFG